MSDEKEKIEKVEASETEPKEIKKEEKKKDKKEGKKGLIIAVIILAALLFVALVGSAILFLNLTRELNDTKLRLKSISAAQYDYPIDDMDDISDEDKKIDDDMEEPVDLEQITKDVEDILGSYEIGDVEVVEFIDDGAKVMKVISQIDQAIGYYAVKKAKNGVYGYGSSNITYDQDSPFYKLGDNGDLVSGVGSFSFNGGNWNESEFRLVIDKILSKLGFIDYSLNVYDDVIPEVINNELGVICRPIYKEYKVQCTSTTWLSGEGAEVARGLARALRVAWPESTGSYSLDFRHIKESANHQYQTVVAGVHNSDEVGGAVGMFYRKKNDPNWVFVLYAQSPPSCSEFSDEAKKAFEGSGVTCVNPDPDGTYSDWNTVSL